MQSLNKDTAIVFNMHVASSDYIETAKEAGCYVELPEAVSREGKERIHLI